MSAGEALKFPPPRLFYLNPHALPRDPQGSLLWKGLPCASSHCSLAHAYPHTLIITHTCCQISKEKRVNIKCEIAFFYIVLFIPILWHCAFETQATVRWLHLVEAYYQTLKWVNIDMKVSKMTLQRLGLFCVLFFKLDKMAFLNTCSLLITY